MKILDLSQDVAGRFGAKLFAGADCAVYRCGRPAGEDDALALYLDDGKRRAEPAELPALLAECDMVWTSFDQGRLLGPAAGLAVPPGCIHVTTSSFGMSGCYAHWRGGSLADWAAGGYLYITGDPAREPLAGPENLCAYAAGYTAAIAAEAALVHRMRGGGGRHLDISTMEAMLLLHQSTFSRTAGGELRRRTGRYTELYPLTVLPCRDGHVSIGVVTDAEFDKLAIAAGLPELTADPRFADIAARWENRDALDRELARYLDQHDAAEIVETFQAGGLAAAAVADALDVARNPQLAHRRFWQDAPGGGVMPRDPLRTFHPFEAGAEPRSVPAKPGDLPLAGVRVLDFTIFWAGPSATRTLADLGAEVIWVERPGARLAAEIAPGTPAAPADVQSHLHDAKMFRGKRSIALDLTRAEDRAAAQALARRADIVVENFRPGVADKLGIGPRELGRINPALTYVSLSGWGAEGPWADWRSYGPSIEAASSIEGRTGYRGGDPLRLGHTLPDGIGGLVGALAALRGLRRRLAGENGGWFDISQLEAYTAMSAEGIIAATRAGEAGERIGNRSAQPGVIQGVFRCAGEDNWIAIRLDGEAGKRAFTTFGGIAVPDDIDAADAAIAAVARAQDKEVLAAKLQQHGLEAFAVLDALELAADAHLRERGYFQQVEAGDHAFPIPGTPLVAQPPLARAAGIAPLPGEHSAQIRAELAEFS